MSGEEVEDFLTLGEPQALIPVCFAWMHGCSRDERICYFAKFSSIPSLSQPPSDLCNTLPPPSPQSQLILNHTYRSVLHELPLNITQRFDIDNSFSRRSWNFLNFLLRPYFSNIIFLFARH